MGGVGRDPKLDQIPICESYLRGFTGFGSLIARTFEGDFFRLAICFLCPPEEADWLTSETRSYEIGVDCVGLYIIGILR